MEPYATVDDLAAGWRDLDAREAVVAEELLRRAAVQITLAMRSAGVEVYPSDELQAEALRMVSCSAVRRAMSVADDLVGVSQYSETAGPYSVTGTLANTSADIWLTDSEREALGIGRYRGAASLRPRIRRRDDQA